MRMPRLPPVPISPQARFEARFCPAVMDSVLIFFQSHSSSSATSCARPVRVPWPISERAMRMTQVSSGLTTTQMFTSAPALSCADAASGSCRPSARPPPAAAELTMNRRREGFLGLRIVVFMFGSSGFVAGEHAGGAMHGGAYALVGAAAADVGHRRVDVGIGGLLVLGEQRCCRHELPGLAVAALRHVQLRPSLLHRVAGVARQPFDGGDPVAGLHIADRNGARADQLPVQVHRTGAALRHAAAVFGPGQPDLLPDHPQERRVGFHLHVAHLAVDVELCHSASPYFPIRNLNTYGLVGDPTMITSASCRTTRPPAFSPPTVRPSTMVPSVLPRSWSTNPPSPR